MLDNKIYKLACNAIKKILCVFGIALIRISAYENLRARSKKLDEISLAPNELNIIKSLDICFSKEILTNWGKSKSQLRQDLLVLSYFKFKKNGFFVEFGATNGELLSNTYLLEKEFNWNGIIAEPARYWHSRLLENRKCSIELNCVWSETGKILQFVEMEEEELSRVSDYSLSDMHELSRTSKLKYPVKTISLVDMLSKYNAPRYIEYLSIDTEGSEYIILEKFPFNQYTFGFISVEHNYTCSREKIHKLMTSNDYARIHENLSLFDDWYVYIGNHLHY